MSPLPARRPTVSLVLVVLLLWSVSIVAGAYTIALGDEPPPRTPAPASDAPSTEDDATGSDDLTSAETDEDVPGPCDDLVGWYRLTERKRDKDRDGNGESEDEIEDGDLLIGVFKHGSAYYSVCRGFEIPFTACPDGLTWGPEPSSMTGTTIGYDEEAETYYLKVVDSVAMHHGHEEGHAPKQSQPLTAIDDPDWLHDPTAPPPRTLDDFLGSYESVYFPYMRWNLHKDGDRYIAAYQEMHEPGRWKAEGEPRDLTPLAGQLGFSGLDRTGKIHLTYNNALKRFELAWKAESSCIRMPLAKFESPVPEEEEYTLPKVRIGIPSWH